jgi:hypothetical protein
MEANYEVKFSGKDWPSDIRSNFKFFAPDEARAKEWAQKQLNRLYFSGKVKTEVSKIEKAQKTTEKAKEEKPVKVENKAKKVKRKEAGESKK